MDVLYKCQLKFICALHPMKSVYIFILSTLVGLRFFFSSLYKSILLPYIIRFIYIYCYSKGKPAIWFFNTLLNRFPLYMNSIQYNLNMDLLYYYIFFFLDDTRHLLLYNKRGKKKYYI